ncbi:glycoside hydrolase family 5 protein [Paraburkholderia sediminicola]|uniref:glycoside hydrolase family 5 protein n=1 Tax=Paraburkholderia sediminicola TaxID=458836 RepID=UPI0038BD3613
MKILIGLLLVGALSACGGSDSGGSSADSEGGNPTPVQKVQKVQAIYSQLGVQNVNDYTFLKTGLSKSNDAYCGTGSSAQDCYAALSPRDGTQWISLGSTSSWVQLDYDICDGVNYDKNPPQCASYVGHVGVKFTAASTTTNDLDGGTASLSPYAPGKAFALTFSSETPADQYPAKPSQYSALKLRGVNLSGGEFDYSFNLPALQDGAYYAALGMNTIRLPFKWEYLQSGSTDPAQRANDPGIPIDFGRPNARAYASLVTQYRGKGMTVVIDMHNYMRYGNNQLVIGSGVSGAPTKEQYAAAWAAIANQFKNQPNVIFGLMNEPNEMSSAVLLDSYNAALAAIRKTGAKNLVLLEGNGWSGAYSWTSTDVDTETPPRSNAEVFVPKAIIDPANNYAIDVHQYFDANNSGTMSECVPGYHPDISGLDSYLSQYNLQAIVTEMGGANTMNCGNDINVFLTSLPPANYLGWVGWNGGSNAQGTSTYFGRLGASVTLTMTLGFQPNLIIPPAAR